MAWPCPVKAIAAEAQKHIASLLDATIPNLLVLGSLPDAELSQHHAFVECRVEVVELRFDFTVFFVRVVWIESV